MWTHSQAQTADSALFIALAPHHSFNNLFITFYKSSTEENINYSKVPVLFVPSAVGCNLLALMCHFQILKIMIVGTGQGVIGTN